MVQISSFQSAKLLKGLQDPLLFYCVGIHAICVRSYNKQSIAIYGTRVKLQPNTDGEYINSTVLSTITKQLKQF
jgi:hypothetical protein